MRWLPHFTYAMEPARRQTRLDSLLRVLPMHDSMGISVTPVEPYPNHRGLRR